MRRNPWKSRSDPYRWLKPRAIYRPDDIPDSFAGIYRATSWSILDGRGTSQDERIQSLKNEWNEVLAALDTSKRDEALYELIEANILYRCLRASIDRAPQLSVIRNDIGAIRRRLEAALIKLNKIEEVTSGQVGRGEALLRQIENGLSGTTGRKRKIDEAVLSRLFEIRTHQFLGNMRFNLERFIAPFGGINIPRKRGKPRKYSKDFLILRCAQIFEEFHSGRHRAALRRYKSRQATSPDDFDRGPFYEFCHMIFLVVDKSAINRSATYGLEKSVQDMLKIRRESPGVDELVHWNSSAEELEQFALLTESARGSAAT